MIRCLISVSSTTYMGQIMAYELGEEPDSEFATRRGELAMLLYSIGELLVPNLIRSY
jgi:solute carrier family 45 protein 1/2/4